MSTWAATTYQLKSQLIQHHLGTPPLTTPSINFDHADREVLESVLEEALGSEDFSGHLSTSDLDRYADYHNFNTHCG